MDGEGIRNAQPELRTAVWWAWIKVDPEDEHLLLDYRISADKGRNGKYTRVRARDGKRGRHHALSHLIMRPPPGFVVDHRNGDVFDNRRANLRVCTQSQNAVSQRASGGTSKYKGVSAHRDKWTAQIASNYIGLFPTEAAAARAYDDAARARYGEFAAVNFPRPGESPAQPVRRAA